ncbi:MAG: biotin--[acetyl-CoA-carboxylase] ligase [Vulcanimicrobiaceae bacterium]
MKDLEHPYARVSAALAGSAFANILYKENTASTNEDAAPLLGDPALAGTTLVSEYQTAGAGRRGRTWVGQAGASLLFTTILPREIPAGDLWTTTFWCALALRRGLANLAIDTDLHWPNDLLIGERKVAGILCISRVAGARAWAACGVGVNVHRTPGGDGGIVPPPSFCDDLAPVTRPQVLRATLRAYDELLPLLDDPPAVAREWEAGARLPGRRYRIQRDGDEDSFECSALSLAAGGGLIVRRDDGAAESIALADARALR